MAASAGEGARVSCGVTAAEVDRLPICHPSLVCPAHEDEEDAARGVTAEPEPIPAALVAGAVGAGVIHDLLTFGPLLVPQSKLKRSFRLDTRVTSASAVGVSVVGGGGEGGEGAK